MRLPFALSFGLALWASTATAQVPVQSLIAAATAGGVVPPGTVRAGSTDRLSVVVELPPGADARARGLVPVGPGFAVVDASVDELSRLLADQPDWQVTWAPPRHVLLDRATNWANASKYRTATGLSGAGAVIGIVDTGLDVTHGDLRDADGNTRVAWLLDFSRKAAGLHPELEAELGCDGAVKCAIFSAADIDRRLANSDANDDPRDPFGHGTHVASLAAGNGRSTNPRRYIGMAPDAQLIIARATRDDLGSIYDADILKSTAFIFDRAEEMGLPAVVNLSLGSDFGAHDGSSPLERALASFVGPEYPGRSIVVAAGNSAGVFPDLTDSYPSPFGIHTEVHVPPSSTARVPLLTDPGVTLGDGTAYIWIATRPGDELRVGVDDQDGEWIEPLDHGEAASYKEGGLSVTIVNGKLGPGSSLPNANGAYVVFDGKWDTTKVYALRLEGPGTAWLWVQSEGDLSPAAGSFGMLFPRATKQGTITVPASHPSLIAVGATLNRVTWTDYEGDDYGVPSHGSIVDPAPDTIGLFSSAGPTFNGSMKPDIVAPGVYVIGAMSRLADPRTGGGSAGMFSGGGQCGSDTECLVVDDFHGISSGTSMAAPIVSGAVALLLERDPTLTQAQVLTLLQAGARWPKGTVLVEQQAGPGALDMQGSLAVQLADSSPIDVRPLPEQSWLALSESYAHPDPEWPIEAVLELRGEDGQIADGFDRRRLSLETERALLTEPLRRVAPGLWRFRVTGPEGSAGSSLVLRVRFDGEILVQREVPIGVDQWQADEGYTARGGCGCTSSREPAVPLAGLGLVVLGLWRRQRLGGRHGEAQRHPAG